MPNNPVFPSTKRIGVFVFDGFEPLDVFGFVEAFAIARFLDTTIRHHRRTLLRSF